MGISHVLTIIAKHNAEILLALIIALIAVFIALCLLIKRVSGLKRRYGRMMLGTDAGNVEDLMQEYKRRIDENRTQINDISNNLDRIGNTLRNCTQRVGIVRYKAFRDTGSDLSFSVALLDGHNNGVVISSIYGRSESIVYAKPVLNGQSAYTLTEEENEALQKAIQ